MKHSGLSRSRRIQNEIQHSGSSWSWPDPRCWQRSGELQILSSQQRHDPHPEHLFSVRTLSVLASYTCNIVIYRLWTLSQYMGIISKLQKSAFSYCSTSRLALGSPGCSFGCSFGRHHARNTLKTLIMLYFWKAKGPRTSKMIFWTVKYTNTKIQIHKYTNTAYDKMPEICYIF